MRVVKFDYDRPFQLQVLRAYFFLKYLGADVFTYKTKNGWHIYAVFPREISKQANLTLRRELGDDPHRIWFDEVRIMNNVLEDWFDTLFIEKVTIKNGKKVSKGREELANPLYEPWFLRRFR